MLASGLGPIPVCPDLLPTPAGLTQRHTGAELVQITSVRPALPTSTTAPPDVKGEEGNMVDSGTHPQEPPSLG
jgi:hypothetical protein